MTSSVIWVLLLRLVMEALLVIVIVKDQQLKVYHDNSFHILLMCYRIR